MDLILEQFPIVFKSLNIGFLQTLKLFFVTLLGAVPLGLVIAFGSMSRFKPLSYLTKIIVWIIRGTPYDPAFDHLFLSGTCYGKQYLGRGRSRTFSCGGSCIYF
jgi:ABC-type amino acid transport system permease subunit